MSDDAKWDKLDSRIDSIDITLGKQQVILEEHQRRSLANETTIDIVRQEVKDRHDLIMSEIAPLLKYADRIVFLLQVIGAIGGFCAAILTVVQIVAFLKG